MKGLKHKIIYGKSEIELKQFDDNTFDSCVTDPPYNLTSITRPRLDQTKNGNYGKEVPFSRVQSRMGGFMGKDWDGTGISFKVELWEEVYRVIKPGAHILVAGIARTHHRMWVALEDAGFDIIDGVYHIFGSGFPKSLDISKAIDKVMGVSREIVGRKHHPTSKDRTGDKSPYQSDNCHLNGTFDVTVPTSKAAKKFEGFGTALKPAVEIWCLARKPISERNIASNVLKWGTGGINVDGCRINYLKKEQNLRYNSDNWEEQNVKLWNSELGERPLPNPQGRFPANLILSHTEECEELYRLKDNIPSEIKKEILEYYGKTTKY